MQYSPADVETATSGDLKPNVLRDWRRRGLLEGIGRQDANGRWRYTRANVCHLAIASYLARQGLTIERALSMAAFACNAVIGWLAEVPTDFYDQAKARYRFVVGYEARGEFQVAPSDNPNFSRFEIGMCHVVNPRLIAESMPKLGHWYNSERQAATRD